MEIVTLRDPSAPVEAQFVPGSGMIGVSLTDAGVQLLGQRRGLDAYVADGKTMGIPLLYPWANRLSGTTYAVDDETVTLAPNTFRTDPNGLPIHGMLAAYPGWRVVAQTDDELTAEVDFGADADLLASFPFPHLLALTVRLSERTLTVRTAVTPTAGKAVPLCYGFHPYLQLPGVPRTEWIIETPPLQHLKLDAHGLPTCESTSQQAVTEPLGDKTFDDGYDQVPGGAVFAVSGGGRRIEVRFDQGYPAAQVFAPPGEDVVCFEPMAAPTDALRRGGYRVAQPGDSAVAQFSIRVGSPNV
ncbi:aldose 1-epimerase [Mycobacterium branderi]|uniref:Aldose 1-epimerase n=1 Tax=Mycobacterium branderi TaxID=43348 RepID=A0A7I7W1T1_9MYCO|nr:aldose 1-epimerase [Mycobacterium branderi]MCV7235354.1 aldose 1-epimerase [Mycobacterium branderi]ORA32976.1 aldose epimerase [Mycobacterium branderi]BBZ10927.1 aldose 1-epimerase [Mycobacterium branderi]